MIGCSYANAANAVEALNLCPINLKLADYWLSLWRHDKPPVRGDFNPKALADVLPGLTVMEVHSSGDVTCRLAGTAVDAALGYPLAGRSLMSALTDQERPIRQHRWSKVVTGSVATAMTAYHDQTGEPRLMQNLHLPFSGKTESGSRIFLLHTNVRPVFRGEIFRSPKWGVGLPDEYRDAGLRGRS